MRLDDAVVWVTGGSSGIGLALVPALVRRGARVVVTARREQTLRELVRAHGEDHVAAVPGDLQDAEGLEALHDRARAAFGRIDVLVNNAGRSQRSSALDTSMQEVRDLMELNFMAPVALTRLAAPAMLQRGRGCIVIVSSVAGYLSTPKRSTYNASKFAVRGWFDALRAELHGTGVGVTMIVPGYVRTAIGRAAVGRDGTRTAARDPVDDGLPPESCAEVIAEAIERDRAEVHVGGKELAGIYLSRWLPGLTRRLAHRLAP